MNIVLKFLTFSFLIGLFSSSCFGQEVTKKKISEEEIKDRFEAAPPKWMKFEKQANKKENPQEKMQALISYGRWKLFRFDGKKMIKDKNKNGFSEKTLETMIQMEKTNGRGSGYNLFTFGLDNNYHATGADYGRSVEEGTYTIDAEGAKITENFTFTSEMHKQRGKKQQSVLKILYLKGDYMILKKGKQLMYLYRV